MKSFDGRVAAITGAGSGIGRALAHELARRGAHLALSDVDRGGLDETALGCEGPGVKVTTRQVDVASADEVQAWADGVAEEHGQVNLVVNNAGVGMAATVEAMSYEDLHWLIDIDLWGVIHGTKAFLPHLKAAGEGHVVNVSSVFGLIGIPTQAAYNTAKFAVRGFTESLRMELEIQDCGVSATVVHPGGIRTNIARNARLDENLSAVAQRKDQIGRDFERMARTTPERAARVILAAVERDRRRVLVGPDARFIDLISRLPIGLHQRPIIRGARRSLL